jgi:large subunit ribosomal protein LP1
LPWSWLENSANAIYSDVETSFSFLIQADKLSTLVRAAGVEVEPVWFSLYAKALAGQDLAGLLMNIGSAGSAAPAAGGAAAAAGGAAEEAAAEEKEEEKEESDDDMGFG